MNLSPPYPYAGYRVWQKPIHFCLPVAHSTDLPRFHVLSESIHLNLGLSLGCYPSICHFGNCSYFCVPSLLPLYFPLLMTMTTGSTFDSSNIAAFLRSAMNVTLQGHCTPIANRHILTSVVAIHVSPFADIGHVLQRQS